MIARVLRSAGFYVREDVRFSELTTFGLGGPCAALVDLDDPARLGDLLGLSEELGRDVMVLGGGSNLLASDEGYEGAVVRLVNTQRTVERYGDRFVVRAGAGGDWSGFVDWCVAEGLCGLECLSGIPGTVGASPVQNVGAYGQEVASTIRAVHAWDRQASGAVVLGPARCRFSYRDSLFKTSGRYVVTAVEFELERTGLSRPLAYRELAGELGSQVGAVAPLADVAEAVLALRRRKGMVVGEGDPDSRSAGSFFTNPMVGSLQLQKLRALGTSVPVFGVGTGQVEGEGLWKVPAAWLVEHAGFARGYTRGRAAISTKHALALVALDGATAADVVGLAREVRDEVAERFGVGLRPEPVLLGLSL